jgi:hypothetical protein
LERFGVGLCGKRGIESGLDLELLAEKIGNGRERKIGIGRKLAGIENIEKGFNV